MGMCFLMLTGSRVRYRASAAVEAVTRELKMRTANMNVPRPAEVNPRGMKRKRTAAPEETCPYCHHIYTVRDGLSTKVDMEGNRYVQRRFRRTLSRLQSCLQMNIPVLSPHVHGLCTTVDVSGNRYVQNNLLVYWLHVS